MFCTLQMKRDVRFRLSESDLDLRVRAIVRKRVKLYTLTATYTVAELRPFSFRVSRMPCVSKV